MENRNDQELARIEKLKKLKEKGIDPYGKAFKRSHNSKEVKDLFDTFTKEELEAHKHEIAIAGRIMFKRNLGKLGFIKLQDREGLIQIVLNKHNLSDDDFELFKDCDLGDIIGIKGYAYKTNTGELSVLALKFIHLTKAVKPLPEKFHGLQDKEERYRRRYLDLITNEYAKKIAIKRPKIIRTIQNYLDDLGLIEVETPVLSPILGGASARPFITYHNTLGRNFYLRIATELPLKRLIVGGLEGVYEIGRLFRNEGMDLSHNPEFTTVEAYVAYSDLQGMMELCEGLFEKLALKINGSYDVRIGDKTISLKAPFKRIDMCDAVNSKTNEDFRNMDLEKALEVADKYGLHLEKHEESIGHIINKLFEELCEEDLIEPTFVCGHPIEVTPLAKKKEDDPRFTERFELFINKREYANAYSELNDPFDQKERFLEQLKLKELGDKEANEMDLDYIEALEYGLPPTGGIGIGIDRLVMLLCETESIREVLLFPTMKPLGSDKINNEKEIKLDLTKVKIEPLFKDYIDFESFTKADFRVVEVIKCEEVLKSKKLLKFTLNDGSDKERIILSGIKEYYKPEELVNKKLVAICNLPPRSMMGIESQGMIISAVYENDDKEALNLIMVDDNIPAGAKLY